MKIRELIWLDNVVDKLIWKHGVQRYEVEEVFAGRPNFRFVEKGHRIGENVYSALGRTEAGRFLIIFFIYKPSRQALIISARDMARSERRRYERN